MYKQVTSAAEAGPLTTRAEPNTVANKAATNMPERFIVLSFSTLSSAGGARTIRAPSPLLSETSVTGKCSMVSPACHARKPIPFSQVSFLWLLNPKRLLEIPNLTPVSAAPRY
ncbi:MAG: hypothetical protein WBW81_03325 [Methylocella sp.]